ncbi:MAG: hypothetical protein M1831_003314 [Alyxoria varia]|nr:MAG: hypothetical protein M1831_003314 [Alyxoria varia]
MTIPEHDVVLIGAGFGAITTMHRYWNCYPGARVDSDAPIYQLFDKDIWQDFSFTERYPAWPELREYFSYINEKLDIEKDVKYNCELKSAEFNESRRQWLLTCTNGTQAYARWFIPAIGFAAKNYIPPIKGMDNFRGPLHHTARWPQEGLDMKDKRIAVIGTGASGVQTAQETAHDSKKLIVYQRTPNFACPMNQQPLEHTRNEQLKKEGKFDEAFDMTYKTFAGFQYDFVDRNTFDDTPEERQEFYNHLLHDIGGFAFWLSTYKDMLYDEKANMEAYKFWRDSVRCRINDPRKREILAPENPPHPWGTKRPSLEQYYFDIFNLPQVDVVDVNEDPIEEITATGIRSKTGHQEFDVIVLATGFDAVTGSLAQLDIRGTDGQTISEHWSKGLRTAMGIAIQNYPNMFFLYGPQAPTALSNGPSTLQIQAEWIEKTMKSLLKDNITRFEAKEDTELDWTKKVHEKWNVTLFPRAKSWYQGSNIPGKRVEPLNCLGDHQQASAAIPNPYEEHPTRINQYTAVEIATLQSRLDRQLGPEYISTRPGAGGGKVHYLAAEKVINLANEVFGFNGWSSQIQDVQVDYADEIQPSGKLNLGISIIVRVTLKDGTFHEDIGYGHIENCKGKAAAFEKAKKEAATDGLKRALRNFGNVLGNCLYDKDYLGKVQKVKFAPARWDPDNLHRHRDYAPLQKQSIEEVDPKERPVPPTPHGPPPKSKSADHEDEFGANVFDEVEFEEGHVHHADDVVLPDQETQRATRSSLNEDPPRDKPSATTSNMQTASNAPQRPQPPVGGFGRPSAVADRPAAQGPNQNQQQNNYTLPPRSGPTSAHSTPPAPQEKPQPQRISAQPNTLSTPPDPPGPRAQTQVNPNPAANQRSNQPTNVQSKENHPPVGANPSVGFTTSRNAELFQTEEPPPPELVAGIAQFDPHFDSPSIRKTSSVNHSTSKPVSRGLQHLPQTSPQSHNSHNPPPAPGQANGPIRQNQQVASGPTHQPGNFINPSLDPGRKIGMPGNVNGGASPHSNRSAWKPPGPAAGVKRPHPGAGNVTGNEQTRPPLSDVSNVTPNNGSSNMVNGNQSAWDGQASTTTYEDSKRTTNLTGQQPTEDSAKRTRMNG